MPVPTRFYEFPEPKAGTVYVAPEGVVMMTEADWKAVQKFVGATLRNEGRPEALIKQMKAMKAVSLTRVESHSPEDDPGYCPGCGTTFKGARGLKSHQSSKFLAMGCKP